MAVLGWITVAGVAVVTGCYSPELRDCAMSCVSSADCAPEQVCGTDRMCSSPELAGRCAGPNVATDAGVDATTPIVVDAPIMVDAPPPIDAAPQRILRIALAGRGGVTVAGIGMCHYTATTLPCELVVPAGMPMSLEAVPDPDNRFDKWESGPCMGQDETCTFIPTLLVTDVKAKFRMGD
jgi:hypothetical protein